MSIWVRSQDEEDLINCNFISCIGREIRAVNHCNHDFFIGEYETKNRCIEVLDAIEAHINMKIPCVFEMPKE